jgi:D-inositol-3-phosphate glycosyltransferase
MRVLYVSHTSVISGAEHSLLVLLRGLPNGVEAVVACPDGELAVAVRAAGVAVDPIPGTNLSSRLHPVHTVRGLAAVLRAALAIRAVARRHGADVIHANTPRAALMCALARGGSGARPIVHVRDAFPPGRLPAMMARHLARRSSAFIPTSQFLVDDLPAAPLVRVIANAVEPERFDPSAFDPVAVRAGLELGHARPVIAVLGQISPHKGQGEAIEILARIRDAHPDACLLVIGAVKFTSAATRYDNGAYEAELHALARRLGVEHAVRFLGERANVAELLSAVDVLLVPSWYEPFGRVALEAMMMRVPVLATSVGGTREVVRDGEDGIVLEPRQPSVWAEELLALLAEPQRCVAMGASARRRALEQFGPRSHVRAIVETYDLVLRGQPERLGVREVLATEA